MARFSIIINDPTLTFSALHCLTFTNKEGHVQAENIHGHDFRVSVTICGPLNEDRMVIDFIKARTLLLKIIENFNYAFLLPLDNPRFQYEENGDNTEITFCPDNAERKQWTFPSEDLYFLDVANTTTEELAYLILSIFIKELVRKVSSNNHWDEYEVELVLQEAPGMGVSVSSKISTILVEN